MTLYLTKTERALYDKLPASLKKAWGGEVAEETGDGWETHEELRERANIVLENIDPVLRDELAQYLASYTKTGPNAEAVDLLNVSDHLLPHLLFIIGASGMALVMARDLLDAKNQEDVEHIAVLSQLRHRLLNTSPALTHGKS